MGEQIDPPGESSLMGAGTGTPRVELEADRGYSWREAATTEEHER